MNCALSGLFILDRPVAPPQQVVDHVGPPRERAGGRAGPIAASAPIRAFCIRPAHSPDASVVGIVGRAAPGLGQAPGRIPPAELPTANHDASLLISMC